MAKRITPFELTLSQRPKQTRLTRWLREQLRDAILDGRLKSGTRLPASRDFAAHYKLSRGTVVSVFEQLHSEGFLSSRIGFGTWVNKLPEYTHQAKRSMPAVVSLPSPLTGLSFPHPAPPFRSHEPALSEFPVGIWARLASRCIRRASASLLAQQGRERESRAAQGSGGISWNVTWRQLQRGSNCDCLWRPASAGYIGASVAEAR